MDCRPDLQRGDQGRGYRSRRADGGVRLGDHAPTAPFPSLRGATTRLLLGGGDAARYRILILASGQPRRPRWAGLLLPPPVRLAAQPRGLMATRGGALEPVLYLPGSGVPLRCGGGAGGRGHGRGRELISGPGRATSDRTRDVLGVWRSGPLNLVPQARLRGFRSAAGAEPEAGPEVGPGAGPGRPGGHRGRACFPASPGVGGRRRGKGLREAIWFPPGARWSATPVGHPLFFPPRATTRRVRSSAGPGAGPGAGRPVGCGRSVGWGWRAAPGPPPDRSKTKRPDGVVAVSRPEPSSRLLARGCPGPAAVESAASLVKEGPP